MRDANVADSLISVVYLEREGIKLEHVTDSFDSVLLDSGGYTIRNRRSLDDAAIKEARASLIDAYAKTVADAGHRITGAFNLDLGGPEESYQIWRCLIDNYGLGGKIIPIWRITEDEKWLMKYAKEGGDYPRGLIGIAGLQGYGPKLDSSVTRYNILNVKARGAGCGFNAHLLGVGSIDTIRRVPSATSFDSSSYARAASFAGSRAFGARGETVKELREFHRYGFKSRDVQDSGRSKRSDRKGTLSASARRNRKIVAILNSVKALKESGIDVVPRRTIA